MLQEDSYSFNYNFDKKVLPFVVTTFVVGVVDVDGLRTRKVQEIVNKLMITIVNN